MNAAIKSTIAVVTIASVAPLGLLSMSSIDPEQKFSWGENVGFMNWRHDAPNTGDGVTVTAEFLAGMIWAENIGWINLGDGFGPYTNDPEDSATFGVNVDPLNGELHGLAWAENVGWINFDTRDTQGPHDQQARVDFCNNTLAGYAWGENVGWINLDHDEHFVALGPDCQAGDVACDGVIGLIDYGWFFDYVTGPGVDTDCPLFDTDGDNDVDLIDFGEFQSSYTGG